MKVNFIFLYVSCLFSFLRSSYAEDLKDIKPPVSFPPNYFLLFFMAIIIALVAGISLVYWFINKYQKKKEVLERAPLKPAHQIAYEALAALKAKNLPSKGKTKEYYIELSDIVRHYLENRFCYRAPEMTTEEFLEVLRSSYYLDGAQKNILKQFLTHCDLVKFAKYGPNQNEIENSFAIAQKLIDETRASNEQTAKGIVQQR